MAQLFYNLFVGPLCHARVDRGQPEDQRVAYFGGEGDAGDPGQATSHGRPGHRRIQIGQHRPHQVPQVGGHLPGMYNTTVPGTCNQGRG